MSLLVKGVTRLSQLSIDADKDWQLKGISNIKELALAMVRGDLLVHDGVRMVRLPAAVANLVLTSTGALSIPQWLPGGLYLNRYFPVNIYLSHLLSVISANHNINRPAPITTQLVAETGDSPANLLLMRSPAITITHAEDVIAAADQAIAETPAAHTHFDQEIEVDGAVLDDGGVLTDETPAAQDLQPASRVAAGAQDSGNSSGAYSNADLLCRMGNNAGAAQNCAFKFTGISIPAGAVITDARIWFTAKNSRSNAGIHVTVKGEAAAAPADYGAAENFTARAYNATTVNYDPETNWTAETQYSTANIATIITALLAAYGPYVAGTMAFEIINNASTASRWQEAYSFDDTPAKAPILVIKYTMANDMHLLPAAPAVGDAYDLGSAYQHDYALVNIGTPGTGAGWTITWKYWNGAWNNLAGVTDLTVGFTAAAGVHRVSFTRPGDWALTNISGHNLYWIRAEVTGFVGIVTQPLGSGARIGITT